MIANDVPNRVLQWPKPFQNQLAIVVKNNPALAQKPLNVPPAPQIDAPLQGTATGFQFSFKQVDVPAGATNTISSYRIYRNTQNVAGRQLVHTFAHDPTHQGSIVFNDHIPEATGQNYFYYVSAVDTTGQESTLNEAQCGAVSGSVGSTPYSNTSSFSYTSTTTSITWSWDFHTNPIYRADGTTTDGGTGSQAITGLSPSTTYLFFPYWDDTTKAVTFVSGGIGTPANAFTAGSQSILAQQSLRTRIPLSIGPLSAATPASGTGGGSGIGGGGGGGGGKVPDLP